MAKSASLHIRLGMELLRVFQELADRQHRSLNSVIEAALLNYAEELELLADPEFRTALKESKKSKGVPWRKAFKNV
ncbi:MAG: ribbon-helix-helix protein, CopG family [Armatimonadota bacterium]